MALASHPAHFYKGMADGFSAAASLQSSHLWGWASTAKGVRRLPLAQKTTASQNELQQNVQTCTMTANAQHRGWNSKWPEVFPNHKDFKAFPYPSPASERMQITHLNELVSNSWITTYINLQSLLVKTNCGRCLIFLPIEGKWKVKVLWTSRERMSTSEEPAFRGCPANTAISLRVHLI